MPTLTAAGFRNSFEGLPREKRVTHPGTHGFPDATFDYLFSKSAVAGKPSIVKTTASDHLPVVCDFTLEPPTVVITRETTIRIPYGSVQIPIGTKVRVLGEEESSLNVEYLGGRGISGGRAHSGTRVYAIPKGNTDAGK